MCVHHYIKNLLVFAALVCSGQFFDFERLSSCVVAFAAFCLVSSAVYIVNDIRDREKDRNHPVKRKRPIASGVVSIGSAKLLAIALFVVAFIFNYIVFHISSTFLLILYFLLNLAYSLRLKNVPILDITILVAGFLIRVIYGALISGIVISNWLYLTVVALSFYFALGKRRNELKQLGNRETRNVLKSYPVGFLEKNMVMCLALANVFYALWSMDEKTISSYNNKYLIFTVPIVMLITMKYSFDVEGDYDGDPVEVLIRDKVLLVLSILYLTVMFIILYL